MRFLLVATVWLVALTCRHSAPPPNATCPAVTWRSIRTPNGKIALCLPPDFRPVDSAQWWARGNPIDPHFAFFSLDILDSAQAAHEWGSPVRPRRLRDPVDSTQLHAVFAESVAIHTLAVDGRSIVVEIARLSGGIGFHRQPFLRAVWQLPGSRWVLAQGWATKAKDLDLIRGMLSTVRMSTAQ
jgi:hypothetical protein